MSILTLGQARVNAHFNPSNTSIVDQIKNKSAELIDLFETMRNGENISSEKHRVISIAQAEIETACMYAVKANFKN